MGFVYQLTNKTNGKRYIGHTSRSIEIRVREHATIAQTNPTTPIQHAIKKYGIENFSIECLFQSESKEESLQKEIFLIENNNPEYNVSVGGYGGDTMSNQPEEKRVEIIRKLSEINKARYSKRKERRKLIDQGRLAALKNRKLSAKEVIEIRNSDLSNRKLSKIYNVCPKTIWSIKNKKRYKAI